MALPDDPQGYAVDRIAGVVHSRYAEHAAGHPRTRSASGARALVGDRVPVLCEVCYPPPPPPPPPPAPPRRRAAFVHPRLSVASLAEQWEPAAIPESEPPPEEFPATEPDASTGATGRTEHE